MSLCVHEFAHAWSAWHLGDDTAARMGRLSLNPFVHADPIGTYLLPLIGAPIGCALLIQLVVTNVGLAVFNLIPIHPLDGGGVADHFMPRALQPAWERISAAGPFLLIGVILLSRSTGFLSGTIYSLADGVLRVSTFLAGS